MIESADLRTIWLLGDPVSHSLSPLIQNTALSELGVQACYLAARVTADDFAEVLCALPKMGALGANVTVPHKVRAFQGCDQVSDRAKKIGAVNTLRFRDGEVWGDNTDGVGWWRALVSRFDVSGIRRALIVGAGGAARAICVTLLENGIEELVILNRTSLRAEKLRADMCASYGDSVNVKVESLASFGSNLREGTLVVQTTSVGLAGEECPVTVPSTWPKNCMLSELLYGRKTSLMKQVSILGGQVSSGLEMLCGQAAESLGIWLGRDSSEVPYELMLKAALAKLDSDL